MLIDLPGWSLIFTLTSLISVFVSSFSSSRIFVGKILMSRFPSDFYKILRISMKRTFAVSLRNILRLRDIEGESLSRR